jgi:dCTP deaminase
MILTGPEIERQVCSGAIHIDPFDAEQLNPNSYDFRLGETLVGYQSTELDVARANPVWERKLDARGEILYPDRIYLGHTLETMGSEKFVPILRAKSSVARLGLFIHVTADLIDIGSVNQWTLQLHAVQPVRIFAGMLIGQVTFWCVQGDIVLYDGKYQASRGPQPSQSYVDFAERPAPARVAS